ncbi:unnamed protein product [Sphagnum balticum]
MGFKTNSSPIDTRLSKMEAAIENIMSFTAVGNLVVNQLMERKAAEAIIAKATFAEEPKWTMVMAKNVRQVVSQAVETLANVPKQEECKFNLRFMGFEAKDGKTDRELVQRLNTELL